MLLHLTEVPLLPISAVLPGLPGFPQTRAPWPVWRDSVAGPVRFAPLSRKQAAQLWHKAQHWDRETHQHGRHGGIIGRTALATLYVLLFDFLNYTTGRLDPSLDTIAAKAGLARRTVVNALARLRNLGLLNWQRRCEEDRDENGRFRLRQRTNAYAVLPTSQWKGYRDKAQQQQRAAPPPPPSRDTLGYPERVPDVIEAALSELTLGRRITALEVDPNDKLAMALAAFARAVDERETRRITEVHGQPRNTALSLNHISANRFAAPSTAARAPNPITEAEVEAEKRRQIALLSGTNKAS